MNSILAAWGRLNESTIGTDRYWSIALQNATIYADTRPLLAKYARGRVLDLGAGKLAWRRLLSRYCESYVSSDFVREHPDLDIIFDATKPYPLASASFDTVFCHSVLEHCREPWSALPEIMRVLKPGGVAIVSVPFIYYLHGQPHDYYRFSRYGLKYLAEQAEFSIEEVVDNGGIVQLLLNVPSILGSSLLAVCRLTRLIPPVTRFWLVVTRALSSKLDRNGLFTINHIAVLRKPLYSDQK